MRATRTEAERFWPKVDVRGPDECWPWTAGVSRHGGYGKFGLTGSGSGWVPAHRWVYEHEVGPIPEGLVVDHICHNLDPSCVAGDACPHRRCCNPAHLEAVTHGENILRGNAPSIRQHHSDTCGRGHSTAEHGYEWRGRMLCRECRRERWAAWYAVNGDAYRAARKRRV